MPDNTSPVWVSLMRKLRLPLSDSAFVGFVYSGPTGFADFALSDEERECLRERGWVPEEGRDPGSVWWMAPAHEDLRQMALLGRR